MPPLLPSPTLYPKGVVAGTEIGDGTVGIGTVGYRATGTPTAGLGTLFLVGILANTEVGDGTIGGGTVGVRATGPQVVAGSTAAETNTALEGSITQPQAPVVGTTATETDTAIEGTVLNPFTVAGATASETDAALAGTVVLGGGIDVAGTTATEIDSALAGTVVQPIDVAGTTAAETDSALAGTVVVPVVQVVLGWQPGSEVVLFARASLGDASQPRLPPLLRRYDPVRATWYTATDKLLQDDAVVGTVTASAAGDAVLIDTDDVLLVGVGLDGRQKRVKT